MRLIALPTSDGGSIAPAAWDIRRNPPRLVAREWCRRCARVIEIDIRKLLPVGVDYDKARF